MYAPFGSGGLIAAKGLLALDPDQSRLATASGEENLAGIAALGKAMELLERIGMDEVEREEQGLTRYALARLAAVPGLKLYGLADPGDPRFGRRGGVVAFELADVPHNLLARRLAEVGGIASRSGCFCVNIFVKHLLGIGRVENGIARAGLALVPKTVERMLAGLVRVSFGITNRRFEIDRLVETLLAIARERRSSAVRALARHHLGTPVVPFTSTTKRIDRLVERALRQVFQEGPAMTV
jgi:cysteine desulfurase / selenocysteine lyase